MTPTPSKPAGEALKACPFCGGEAQRMTIGEDEPNNAGGDVIVCTQCQASGHVEFGRKENLVSRWNARTPPPSALDDEVVAAPNSYPTFWRDIIVVFVALAILCVVPIIFN